LEGALLAPVVLVVADPGLADGVHVRAASREGDQGHRRRHLERALRDLEAEPEPALQPKTSPEESHLATRGRAREAALRAARPAPTMPREPEPWSAIASRRAPPDGPG